MRGLADENVGPSGTPALRHRDTGEGPVPRIALTKTSPPGLVSSSDSYPLASYIHGQPQPGAAGTTESSAAAAAAPGGHHHHHRSLRSPYCCNLPDGVRCVRGSYIATKLQLRAHSTRPRRRLAPRVAIEPLILLHLLCWIHALDEVMLAFLKEYLIGP